MRKEKQQPLIPADKPFALPFAFIKAFACALALATVISVVIGCNDSKFRAKLRTTYPYAALWVDMIKGAEDVEEEQKNSEATDEENPFETDLRAGMLEVKKE